MGEKELDIKIEKKIGGLINSEKLNLDAMGYYTLQKKIWWKIIKLNYYYLKSSCFLYVYRILKMKMTYAWTTRYSISLWIYILAVNFSYSQASMA